MVKVRGGGGTLQQLVLLIMIIFFFFIVLIFPCSTSTIATTTTTTVGNKQQQRQCTSSSFLPAVGKIKQQYHYWSARLFNQLQTYFFPPNLDFRGTITTTSTAAGEADSTTSDGGGEKVKAAVAKSLGKSKETIEDSAKSAANKFKQTLSDIAPHRPHPHPRPEL